MTKNAVIKQLSDSITTLTRWIEIINTIPLNQYLKINTTCHEYENNSWKELPVEIYAKPIGYNGSSVQVRVLASSHKNYKIKDPGTIPFRDIISWQPLNLKELPLAVSWPVKYPVFNNILRTGKLPSTNARYEVYDNLEIKTTRMAGGQTPKYKRTITCPSCGNQIEVYSKGPTIHCNECGYGFQVKEKKK